MGAPKLVGGDIGKSVSLTPSSESEGAELAAIETWMTSTYGKGQYCPKQGPLAKLAKDGQCLHLDDLSKVIAKSHNYDELLEAWSGWHAMAPQMKDKFARYVELGNKGSNGGDLG